MGTPTEIRRPRPSPRQGRRLGPPQVWNLFLLACHYLAFRQALRPLPSVVKGVQACYEQALRPLPSVVKGVQACRLPPKTLRGSSEHCPLLLRAFKPAVCQASGHCPLLLRAFKPAVCQASNASNARGSCLKRCAAASSKHSGHCPLLLRAFKPATSRHSDHCPLLLRAFKPAVCHLKRCAAAPSTALCC